jgi:YfiR/HmsC-like
MAITLTLLFAPHSTRAQGSVPTEYKTKASYLATFPSFIEWPETAFASAEAPFLVCVLGDFRFGTALAEFARNPSPHGRRIDIRWARKNEDLRNCHILFISNSEAKNYARILKLVQGAGILTVGETRDFLSAGGMLTFSFHDDSLQFEVNLVAADEAHLRVSSKLLALARRVVTSGMIER